MEGRVVDVVVQGLFGGPGGVVVLDAAKSEAHEGLSDDVENRVSVSFTLDGNHAGLRDTGSLKSAVASGGGAGGEAAAGGGAVHGSENPDDGVANPSEKGDASDSADNIFTGLVVRDATLTVLAKAEAVGAAAALVADDAVHDADEVQDGEEGEHGEAEESPAFTAFDEFTNKASNDHEHIHKHKEPGGNIVTVGQLGNLVKHDGGGEGPVDVTGVVEVTAVALGDEAIAEGHGEVGEGSNSTDNGGGRTDRVEVLVFILLFGEGHAEEVKEGNKEKTEGNPENNVAVDTVEFGVDGATRAATGHGRGGIACGFVGSFFAVASETTVARLLLGTVGFGLGTVGFSLGTVGFSLGTV